MNIYSAKEIEKIKKSAQLTKKVLDLAGSLVDVNVSTKTIDDDVIKFIRANNAKPAFLGYMGYPASVCISVNEEVVHGIPLKHKRLRDGDIVSFDTGTIVDGFYGDAARTLPVGTVSKIAQRLMDVTKKSLELGIEQAKPGNRVGDIGAAIQSYVESQGFSVVRDFVGHCLGKALHEDPQIPNYGMAGTGPRLKPGMVLAIEPMINEGSYQVRVLSDKWTAVTFDGKLSAHFEHDVAILSDGPEILSN